jgi:GTPase SAR1 family protein
MRQRARIRRVRSEIASLQKALAEMTLWQPAGDLALQCAYSLKILAKLEARLDRKLVITLIGPCGSGKSTLLNALAGQDGLSPTGHQRPTTRNLVVLTRRDEDAAQLVEALGRTKVLVRTSKDASALQHVILVDTPDTDSTEGRQHVTMVQAAIGLSDVLICVFDAENPKRRDQADFLAPYVRKFGGRSLVVVLNKCDRLDAKELRSVIVPEFDTYLQQAWQIAPARILCVSGRRHLQNPAWAPEAKPRHDFDQYSDLKILIFDTLNQAGSAGDRRLENAQQLRDYLFDQVRTEMDHDLAPLVKAREALQQAESEAFTAALTGLMNNRQRYSLGVSVIFYHLLAQRWTGPVGWLVAMWARILMFGAGLVSLLRPGNPMRQVWALINTWRRLGESRAASAEARQGDDSGLAMAAYRRKLVALWPDVAEALVAARFDHRVRVPALDQPTADRLHAQLAATWEQALGEVMERSARQLASGWLQLLFNLPVLGVLAYVGWITGREFFAGRYLPGEFFLHAFITAGLILVLGFFVYQAIVRVAARPERMLLKTFQAVAQQSAPLGASPLHPAAETLKKMGLLHASLADEQRRVSG